MQRKLTLTAVVLLVTLGGVAGQTAQASSKRATSSYVKRGLLCIHHYEGSWTDPNWPYWGGLQMDMNFQRAYGWMRSHHRKVSFLRKWGTADHWPIWAQLLAGRHGYNARGWSPWPNTARYCGLM